MKESAIEQIQPYLPHPMEVLIIFAVLAVLAGLALTVWFIRFRTRDTKSG